MFLQGEIVKSKQRSRKKELFLMVLFEPNKSASQFNAVVLKDFAGFHEPALISNSWNMDQFNLSSWDELRRHL